MLVKPQRLAGKPSLTNAVKRWHSASRKMDSGKSNAETYVSE